MTGYREPPAEWIPLIAAIVRIADVQEAFERALISQIEVEMGRNILSDSFPNKMVGPDSAVTFLLSGFRVIATARGRLTTVLDDKADDALGEIAARAVKVARGVAGFAVARLMTDGIYKAHGRHETLRSPLEPIPGDLVYARAVSFDIGTGIASYSDGTKAGSVHLERIAEPSAAKAVTESMHDDKGSVFGDAEPESLETNFDNEHSPARGPEAFARWFSRTIDDAGMKKAMKREDVWKVGVTDFGLSLTRARLIRRMVLETKSPAVQALFEARGAPEKIGKKKRHTGNDPKEI
jgi:hypothetical protein